MMLVDLEASGIRLSEHCERLLVDAPTGALTPELRAYLAVHKSKLLDELRQTQEPSEPIQPLGYYKLSELLRKRTVVRVKSRILGETVIWVADGVEVPEQPGEVVYRESELRQVVGKSPAELRAIHGAKRAIDGELVQ